MKANKKRKRKTTSAQAPTPDAGAPETTTPTAAQLEAWYGHDMPSAPPVDDAWIDQTVQEIREALYWFAKAAQDGDPVAYENLCRMTLMDAKMLEILQCSPGNTEEETIRLIDGVSSDPTFLPIIED
jgi:TPR repeat protein